VNPEQLRDLGFQLEGRAPGGESGGAWFAIAADGARVVLKWFADEGVADRYAVLLPALDVLRSRGVPVPEYPFVRAVDGWTLSAQQVLPGRSFPIAPPRLVDRMIECVGAAAEPSWFPTSGLVHFDLHTDNVLALDDGTLTGIIDWEGACAGDHRYDLVAYAFDLDGHGQQIWDRVEPLVEPHMLRAYVAHMALRRTDWAIRHHPENVPRQLDRAERLLDRYGA